VFLSIFRNVFRRDVDSLTSERRQKSNVDVDEQKSRQKQEASSRQHRQTRRSQGNLVAAGKKEITISSKWLVFAKLTLLHFAKRQLVECQLANNELKSVVMMSATYKPNLVPKVIVIFAQQACSPNDIILLYI
jgi:hypothetical protein